MPDAAFAHPRLAALYDVAQAGRDDLVHYEHIVAEFGAATIVDLGCGTGTLACRLAATGRQVTGVDPAQASLDVARAKDPEQRVRWLIGDAPAAAAVIPNESIDMALMTGNVAQVFLGDDWDETLVALHQLLLPGGHLVFETRDPAFRGWEEWNQEQSRSIRVSPVEGAVESWVDLVDVALPFVTFQHTYRFLADHTEMQSVSTLRFRDRAEIDASLNTAGFEIIDVRQAPDRPHKQFVYIASKPSPGS